MKPEKNRSFQLTAFACSEHVSSYLSPQVAKRKPVPVRRPRKLARSPSLLVLGRFESEEPTGDPDVGSHVLWRGDVAVAVGIQQRLPALGVLELNERGCGESFCPKANKKSITTPVSAFSHGEEATILAEGVVRESARRQPTTRLAKIQHGERTSAPASRRNQ